MSKEYGLRVGLCGIGSTPTGASLRASKSGSRDTWRRWRRVSRAPACRWSTWVLSIRLAGSRQAGHRCRREDIDLLFLYVTTYALSDTVLPSCNAPACRGCSQPSAQAAIDYQAFNKLKDRTAMTGEWLAFCSACPVPEIANLFTRARIPFHQVTGVLDEA